MLVHIVIWKYNDDISSEIRNEHVEKLRALPKTIPNIDSFEVGQDILKLGRSYDTALVAVFPDKAALDSYTVHDEHQKVVEFGKRIASHAASVDFLREQSRFF